MNAADKLSNAKTFRNRIIIIQWVKYHTPKHFHKFKEMKSRY